MAPQTISHYRILEKLGAGGMGEVFLAEDTKLGRKVAVKLLSAELTQNRDRLHRFEQEASTASSLNHPNILTIHEIGFADGHHFIATEFVDGQTLRKRIAGPRLEISEALEIGMQVAGALEEAHTAGIVYRDIKPENIMIRRNGIVKVLDFGLAKLTELPPGTDTEAPTRALVHTDAGTVMGTSYYMSPEQARGKQVDARTDIWSLGVVLYEMVAGHVPFEGETATDVLVAITKTEPPPLARYAQGVPAEFDWIVMKALRKDASERYQTAKELQSDLRKLKQRLEFEAELERSVPPDRISSIISGGMAGSGAAAAASVAPSLVSGQAPAATSGSSTAAVSGAVPTKASSAEYIVTGIKRHKKAAMSAAFAIVVVAAVAGYFSFFRKPAALTDKDTILLADFVNTTGDAVFDGTLKQALAVQLSQSPFLNIFGDDRVREALRFMGRSPDERVTRDIAREICQRQGLKALLAGSISALGSQYVVTLEAINAQTGDTIAREQAEAESKEKVLSALGQAASHLREKLGESLGSIKKYDVPVEQATTSSLEALKAFAIGNDQRQRGQALASVSSFKRAIELDPNFAMAYARLAVFYGNSAQGELAEQYAQKAFELRDRVSEHERFYISEKYYEYVTGEIDKSVEVEQAWAQTYPNDYIPHNNLSFAFVRLGRLEDALKEAQEAARLDPKNVTPKGNVIDTFINLGRYDEARQLLEEQLPQYPEAIQFHFVALNLAFLRGDQAALARETQWFRGKAFEPDLFAEQARAAAFAGQLSQSADLTKRGVEMFSEGRKENASQLVLGIALNQAVFGDCQKAKQSIAGGLGLSRGRISLGSAALALAACNEAGQAQATIDEASKRFPKDTAISAILIPISRATLESKRGNYAPALELLEPVRRYEMGNIAGFAANYLRGQIYLGQRMGAEAAVEFQKILDHRGADILSSLYPLSYLGLARATVLQGDTAKARTAYQDFFALWKDADPNVPILIEAKSEYEKLK
jgi:eukaryotic-like serine/threonine-protein kinase